MSSDRFITFVKNLGVIGGRGTRPGNVRNVFIPKTQIREDGLH